MKILACMNILGRFDETYLRTSPKISYDTFKICPRNFIDETGHWVPKYIWYHDTMENLYLSCYMLYRIHTGEHR